MELNTNYEAYYFEDLIGKYAISKQKGIVYLRSWGWNNTSDVDAINASMSLYRSRLPLDIYTALTQSEFVFLEVDNVAETMEFCEDMFPASQASTAEKAHYIFYAVYNAQGQKLADNE